MAVATMSNSVLDLKSIGSGDDRVGGAAWLDVESEPAVFQEILRKLGAKGVRVQEIYGLEEDYFFMLTGQVLGLIFLFNYRQVDGEDEEEDQTCPEHVWFANQTSNNSCATVAMLNILLNIPGIRFDSSGLNVLPDLKSSTSHMVPVERGHCLSDNVAIRQIHNASAREIDAINASLTVQNDFDAWIKSTKSRRKSTLTTKRNRNSGGGGKKKKSKQDNDEAFHYIAYVPIGDEVWRLDGLLKQPRNLGKYEGDWTGFARQNIMDRIREEADLDYNLMALCASDEQTILLRAFENARSIEKIRQGRPQNPDVAHYWKSNDPKPLRGSEFFDTFGITHDQVVEYLLTNDKMLDCRESGQVAMLKKLVQEQDELKHSYGLYTKSNVGNADAGDSTDEDLTDATYEIIKTLVDAGIIPANSRR